MSGIHTSLAWIAIAAAATMGISPAVGAPVSVGATVAAVGTLRDTGPNGTYDSLGPSTGNTAIGGAGFGFLRQAMVVEFTLPTAPAGATLSGASLYVDDMGGGNLGAQTLGIFMFAGDGVVSLADAGAGTRVGTKSNVSGLGLFGIDSTDLNLDILASYLAPLIAGGASKIGFFIGPDQVLSSGSSDLLVLTATGATIGPALVLTYDTANTVPEPNSMLLGLVGLAGLLRAQRLKAN